MRKFIFGGGHDKRKNYYILVANNLVDNGIPVWAFITPILPYIMDIEEIIDALHEDIPIYLDKLRIEKKTVQADNMKKFIRRHYPEYIHQYNKIIQENNESYLEEVMREYTNNNRVKILF